MAVTVTMPQLGETVTEGVVLRWAKQVGDTIAEDEVLLEISTDKVDTEIPSPIAGVIQEILVPEGETVEVGAQLAIISEDGAAPVAPSEPEMPVDVPAEVSAPAEAAADVPEPAPEPASEPEAPPASAHAAPGGEGFTVVMPQLGETVTEGVVLAWSKAVGDTIAEDEVLLEISTDKVDTEIPSPTAGVVQQILVEVGDTAEVGTALAIIAPAGAAPASVPAPAAAPSVFVAEAGASVPDNISPVVSRLATEAGIDLSQVTGTGKEGRITRKDVDAFIAAGAPPATIPTAVADPSPASPTPPTPVDNADAKVSPVVRRLARENGIDLAAVTGTGLAGRITRQDVEDAISGGGAAAPAEPTPVASPSAAPAPPVAAPSAPPAPVAPSAAPQGTPAPTGEEVEPPEGVPMLPGDRVLELDRLRQRIAKNMIIAKETAAHVWTVVEVDYEALEQVRQKHKAAFKEREGYSLTYLPFITRAVVDALGAFPVVNSSIYPDQGKAVYHEAKNIGIAIDLNQQGLLVGTVRNADNLRIVGISRSIKEVADRARTGSLEPDDVSGSTFSISNPGPFGSFVTAPIINVPNTAILSTDTVTKRPVVTTDAAGNDSIAIRHIGYLGLTWDHRAFDGSTAVLFLQRIKHNLETWDWEQELA